MVGPLSFWALIGKGRSAQAQTATIAAGTGWAPDLIGRFPKLTHHDPNTRHTDAHDVRPGRSSLDSQRSHPRVRGRKFSVARNHKLNCERSVMMLGDPPTVTATGGVA